MTRTVVFTNMYAELGGGELCLLAHLRHALGRGWRVSLGLLAEGPLAQEAARLGVPVRTLPFRWQGGRLRSLRLIARRIGEFARFLRERRAELLICYTFNDLVLAGTAARLVGIPVVYRAQGELFLPGRNEGRTWLGRWLVPFFRLVRPLIICTTQAEAAAMKAAGIPPALVRQVYLGVDGAFSGGGAAPPPDTRAAPVVAMFGRLVEWKGQDVFLRALAELKRRGVAFEAWIVGDAGFGDGDAYAAKLRAMARENGIAEEVKFLGFRRDVAELMACCDVVCHASRFEPFGMVVVEAMMAGRPVVASDVSGPRESVLNGVTGLLVPPGNPAALAHALGRLLPDPELRAGMGRAGQERARHLFDLEKNFARVDQECEALLGAR
jgi:glycosyltransferase involved in cell wall biosynthesis